jgi:hypothetical protein
VRYEYHAGRDPVYDPKPAYVAAKTLTTTLGGYRFASRVKAGAADDFVLQFSNGNEFRLAAWTRAAEARTVTVPVTAAPRGTYRVIGHTGDALPQVEPGAEGLKLTLTDAPQYLVRE